MRSPAKVMRAAVRREDAGDHVEQRGLAGAVRADHREDLPCRHVEADSLSTATRPRKRLLTSSTERSALICSRSVRPSRRASHGQTPSGSATITSQQADAVEHLLGARHIDADRGQRAGERLGQSRQNEGAEHRPEQGADAADDRRQDDLDRARDVEHLLGEQVVVIERVEHAGEGRHAGRDHHRDHLVAEGVDAGRARGLLVLADRQPEIADAALAAARGSR